MYSDKMSKCCCCDLFKIHKKTSNCVVTCYHKSFSMNVSLLQALVSGFYLVYLALLIHWSNFADRRPSLAAIAQMTVTDNTYHPLSAVQLVFLAG